MSGPRAPSRFARMLRTMADTFWILVLAVIVLFAFFLALGAFSPGDVAVVSLVVLGLTVAWVIHALWESRHREGRDPATIRARERRGF